MRTKYVLLPLLLVLAMGASGLAADKPQTNVMAVTVEGVINPVTAELIIKSIQKANKLQLEAIVIELDTPGGLVTSMRLIIKEMLGSDVPVVVFVSPRGARAASAGTFMTLAAHVAAMAPQTNMGAAHPVNAGGGKMDKTMSEKITNDSVAYIKSLAEKRGRNAKWAEDAVRKSVSVTETEALEKNIIDLISDDLSALLKDIDGMKVTTTKGEVELQTAGATVMREEMSLRQRILGAISDPSVAYILMMLGFYGLFFEMTKPGAIFPGVVGAICLILAFYSFQTLPVNYAGLLLILLAIVMFILEVKVVSYGALTIGGMVAMVLGSLMLFDSAAPFYRLSLGVVLPVVIVTALFFIALFTLVFKALRAKPVTGVEALVGEEGMARSEINAKGGTALVHGEMWSAHSEEPIAKGEALVVESVKGLKVSVRKTTKKEV